MPKVNEAAVPVAGVVVGVENVENFETKKYEGQKVLVATADGYVSVKLDAALAAQFRPDFGQRVAWVVRYGAYANRERGTDAITTTRFIREADQSDVDALAQAIASSVTGDKKAA